MKTDKWDDDAAVQADLDKLKVHVRELKEKYGDRLPLLSDDP